MKLDNYKIHTISLVLLLVVGAFLSTKVSGQKLKIMPLGNSITFGEDSSPEHQEQTTPENCIAYRKALYNLLIGAGYTFDFVGSQHSGWDAGLPQNDIDSLDYCDNAGFPGLTPGQLNTLLLTSTNPRYGGDCELSYCPQNYLEVFDPDIILLHIGTNGLSSYADAEDYRDDINDLLDIVDAYEASVGRTIPVFLAQIINRRDNSTCLPTHAPTAYFNDLLAPLVTSRNNGGDEIILVDMENISGFCYKDEAHGGDMFDDLHPAESGYELMAEKWFEHLDYYNYTAPHVGNIPNLTIYENESSKTINLNNYVFDPQDPDEDITWSFTPNPSVHFNISIANGIATVSNKNPAWEGNETITFKAEDSGNGSTPLFDTDEVTIYAVAINDTPVILSQQPISVLEDSQVAIGFGMINVYDPDNTYPDDFTLHVLPGSNYTIVGNYTVKPNPNYNGTIYVPVYVNDGLTNSNTFNLTVGVTPVNDNPWLNIPSNRTAYEGSSYSITITPGDFDIGDDLDLIPLDIPEWLSFNSTTGLLRGTPFNDDVGIYSVKIRVNDGTVNVDSTFSVEVINTNDIPVITSYPEDTSIFTNEYFEYFIVAEDSDINDVLSYSAPIRPSFLTLDIATHKLSGTPLKNDTGNFPVSLKVGDGTVFVYQNFNLHVELKTHAPEITSVHVYSVYEDTQYLYALKASDLDNDILNFSAVKIPDWTNFYPSGILMGTPTNDDVGFYDIVLSVTDGLYTVYDSFNIEVINVNDPPVILGTSKTLITPKETPIEITLSDISVEDDDNKYPDDFSLELFTGNHYTVIDNSIIPNTSFLGKLNVNISVNDGLDSDEAEIPVYVGDTSIDDFINKEYIHSVYPVPANDNINFKFNLLNEDAELTFYDISVKPLKVIIVPAQTRELMIDIKELPVGVIFYKINYKQGYNSGNFIIVR
jgi:lysophospholipase L1-like esterase